MSWSSASIRPPGKTKAPAAKAIVSDRSIISNSGGPAPACRIRIRVAAGIGSGRSVMPACLRRPAGRGKLEGVEILDEDLPSLATALPDAEIGTAHILVALHPGSVAVGP